MSDTPEETARKKKLLEELWQLDEQIEEQMTTNNSNTTEVINNSNTTEVINNSNKTEVTNIVNKVVKCDCKEDATKERDRVIEILQTPAEGQLRGIRTGITGLDDSETGLIWGWKLVPEEGEPALFTNGEWVSLMPLIEGDDK